MADRALAMRPQGDRYQNQQQALDVGAAKEEYLQFTSREFYSARGGGGRAPSARLVKQWALDEHINCEVIEYGADKEKAWAKVRAWKGDRENPTIVREDALVLMYQDMLAAAVFEAIDGGVYVTTGFDQNGKKMTKKITPEFTVGENGIPILTDLRAQFSVLKTWAEKKKFSTRAAISTAKRRVFLEMLGFDKDDDADEDEEGLAASGEKKSQPSSVQPPSEQAVEGENVLEQPTDGQELAKLRADIGTEMMKRSQGDKEGAGRCLQDFTAGMLEAHLIVGAYRFPSRIPNRKEAQLILDIALAQSAALAPFVASAQGNQDKGYQDFQDVLALLSAEGLSIPPAEHPNDIFDIEILLKISEVASTPPAEMESEEPKAPEVSEAAGTPETEE